VTPRELAAQAIAANPNKSNRAIAAEIGVSNQTVMRRRKATAPHGAVEKRMGLDGRTRRVPPTNGHAMHVQKPNGKKSLDESVAELARRGRKYLKIKSRMPKGADWNDWALDHCDGYSAKYVDKLIRVAKGGHDVLVTMRQRKNASRYLQHLIKKGTGTPKWVQANVHWADPRISIGVIEFLIARSVRALLATFPTLVPTFFDHVREVVDKIEQEYESQPPKKEDTGEHRERNQSAA
jgi:hypothetical protein